MKIILFLIAVHKLFSKRKAVKIKVKNKKKRNFQQKLFILLGNKHFIRIRCLRATPRQ
jgi:hypothetical protein